jgi:hypothetical protein
MLPAAHPSLRKMQERVHEFCLPQGADMAFAFNVVPYGCETKYNVMSDSRANELSIGIRFGSNKVHFARLRAVVF